MIFLIMIIVGESPDHLADPAKEREKERERQDNGTFNGFLCKSSLTMEKETSQSTISVKPFSTPLTLKKQNRMNNSNCVSTIDINIKLSDFIKVKTLRIFYIQFQDLKNFTESAFY